MVGDHDDFFSTARTNGKSPKIVSVKLAYWVIPDVELACTRQREKFLLSLTHCVFGPSTGSDWRLRLVFWIFGGGVDTALGFVERKPCRDCVMCPLIVSTDWGQHLDALEYVSPGHVEKSHALIDFSQVDLVGNPAAACR